MRPNPIPPRAQAANAPLLPLAYGPVAPRKLAALERLGRALGLPLDHLEALGRDEPTCDAFLAAHPVVLVPRLVPPGSAAR